MNFRYAIGLLIFILIISMGVSNKKVEAASIFTDLPEDHEGHEDVMDLVNLGVINGFPDDTFRPYERLTRSQGAILIGKALELDVDQVEVEKHTFSDVYTKVSGYEYIHALTNMGVYSKAEKFNPYEPLTRAQMAKILVKSFHLKGTSNHDFRDVSENHWAYDYIQTLVSTEITVGTSSNTYSPDETVTRMQMAKFIHRTLNYSADKPTEGDESEAETENPTFNQVAEEVLEFTNKERTKRGLQPLKNHAKLQNVAMKKAKDFYVNDYFDHDSPVYGGPFEMMDQANIQYLGAGENIAGGYGNAKEAVDGWMLSPGHKANILTENFTHMGVGFYMIQEENATYLYYVQMFIEQ